MRLRCLRRSKAEPQTNKSSHIATHNATFGVRCSMNKWVICASPIVNG